MVKTNFNGNYLNYWTMILIGECLVCEVEGYGTIEVRVDRYQHEDDIQGTWVEGTEQVAEGQSPKMGDGKVFGVLYWNVDDHIMHPAAPPIPLSPDAKKVLTDVRAMLSVYT